MATHTHMTLTIQQTCSVELHNKIMHDTLCTNSVEETEIIYYPPTISTSIMTPI